MNLGKLFSFDGRVRRTEYWVMVIAISIVNTIAAFMLRGNGLLVALGVLIILLTIIPGLTTSVKRWHDRDKSGWWILIGLIPLIGGIWALVEQGFLRGTDGDNRFGAPENGSALNA